MCLPMAHPWTQVIESVLLQFPSQVAACLQNPVLQHLMAYSADKVVAARFNFWLQHTLTEGEFDPCFEKFHFSANSLY